MSKVFVILAEGQYNDTWIERIYTSLDKAKEFLIVNYKYWWEGRDDLDEEDYNESIESIQSLTEADIADQNFYVDLTHRGVTLTLSVEQLDESITTM